MHRFSAVREFFFRNLQQRRQETLVADVTSGAKPLQNAWSRSAATADENGSADQEENHKTNGSGLDITTTGAKSSGVGPFQQNTY